MRGKKTVVALAAGMLMASAGASQAAVVTTSYDENFGFGWVRLHAQAAERNDITVRITDETNVVTISDKSAPLATTLLPGQTGEVCPLIDANTAQCTFEDRVPSTGRHPGFEQVLLYPGAAGSTVRDLPGADGGAIDITSGPGSDDINIRHNWLDVSDDGGINTISSGAGSYLELGPGRNVVDIKNGVADSVTCRLTPLTRDATPAELAGLQILNEFKTDTHDYLNGC